MLRTRVVAALAVTLALARAASAQTAQIPPRPEASWICDDASVLKTGESGMLDEVARIGEQQHGAKLIVLTLADSRGEDPKSIAVRTLNEWHAGKRSVLILVVMKPQRKLYVQPGTELATIFDAETASTICRDAIAPKLKAGAYGEGLRDGLRAISAAIQDPRTKPMAAERVAPTASPDTSTVVGAATAGAGKSLCAIVGVAGVVMVAVALSRIFARKCPQCGTRMGSTSRTIESATTFSSGRGETTYYCTNYKPCGYRVVESYVIPVIDTSSSSSSSSWDSSSSSSSGSDSSSSSSSSSSDGSGGGGSDF